MDGEFNLSNTIGIGLNIGEQMLLPVSNGEDEQQQQHHQHYTNSLHQNVDYPTNVDNNPTNVSAIENPMGNYYQGSTDLENLNARLAETTEILGQVQEDKPAEQIHQVVEPSQEANKPETINEENILEEDDEEVEEEVDEEEGEADEEDDDEAEADEAVEEEIIPDEIKTTANQKDNDTDAEKTKDENEETNEDDKEKDETEQEEKEEQDGDDDDEDADKENNESEQPSSSSRASRRKQEEDVDENQCRVCCSKDDLSSLFKKVESQTVAEMLMTICPSIYITVKDFLPQYICNACSDNVVKAIELKKLCETTEKELRKKLSRHKNKIRRPVGYVVIDAPLDSDPPTDEEQNDEEFKVSDIASVSPSEDSEDSEYSDSKKKKTRGRKRRKSAVSTPTDSKKSKNKSDNQSSEEDEDDDDGDPIKSVKRKRSNNSSSPENYACDECNKSFSRKQSLVLHKRQHVYEGGEPISCEVCGKKFKIKGAYRTHLEKHKEEKRTCKCGKCSRIFKNRADLNRHLAEDHKKRETVVSCSKCKRTFNSSSRLQRHKQGRCPGSDSNKAKKPEINAFAVGTDLFKTVAPLQTTYWSDSFSD